MRKSLQELGRLAEGEERGRYLKCDGTMPLTVLLEGGRSCHLDADLRL